MRRRFLNVLLFFISLLFINVSCRKDKMDEYYNRPDWLAQPMYQQLQSGDYGDFSLFLKLIDKAGYKNVLDRAGYYTLFAPTDSAFQAFLDESYSGSINNIDSTTAQKMVSYLLVYNAFDQNRIDDYQSSKDGWKPDMSFKKRTVYYKGIYTDPLIHTRFKSELLVDNNSSPYEAPGFAITYNGNKFLPFFTTNYFNYMKLTAYDYNFFYPETPFTGFNVAGAKVLRSDIKAENGYIHVISKMIAPLPNIDEYLAKTDKYSRFKEILDSFVYLYASQNDMSVKYERLTGIKDTVFVKYVDKDASATLLGPAFAPNNENWYSSPSGSQETHIAQTDGWTIFAPENEVVEDFLKNKLCKYYGSLGNLPKQIIYDFVNSYMSGKSIWPNQIPNASNALGDKMTDIIANITDKKILSNGIFYGVNAIHKSKVFYTVFGDLYLNPRYSLMTRVIVQSQTKESLAAGYTDYTIFMIPDDVFEAAGFRYNITTGAYEQYVNGAWATSNDPYSKILRIVKYHIVKTDEGELNDLSGQGTMRSFGDEYIKFNNNTVFATGNIDTAGVVRYPVHVSQVDANPSNGKVYEVDRIMLPPAYSIRSYIGGNPNFSNFYALLKKTTLFSGATSLDVLLGNSENMILIPTNEAIAGNKIFTETDVSVIERFIKYHIVPKRSFLGDGTEGGTVNTFLTLGIEPNTLTINNGKDIFNAVDETGNVGTIIRGQSYVLGNKTIIHQIDRVLSYLTK